jgi:hypothetical protein
MDSKQLSTTMVDTKTYSQQFCRKKHIDRRFTSSDDNEARDLDVHFHKSGTDDDLTSPPTLSGRQPSLGSTTVSSRTSSLVRSTVEEKAAIKTADTDLESRHRPPEKADTALVSPSLSTPKSLKRLKQLDPLKDSKNYLNYDEIALFQVQRHSPRPKPNTQFKTIRERLLFGEDHSERGRSRNKNTKKQEAIDNFKRAERERSISTTPTQSSKNVLTGILTPRQSRRVSSPRRCPVSPPLSRNSGSDLRRHRRQTSASKIDPHTAESPHSRSRRRASVAASTADMGNQALWPDQITPTSSRRSLRSTIGLSPRGTISHRQTSASKIDPHTAESPHPRSRRRASIAASTADVGNQALRSHQITPTSSRRSLRSTIGLSPRGTISPRRRRHTKSPRHSRSKIGMLWSDRNITNTDKKQRFLLQPPEL